MDDDIIAGVFGLAGLLFLLLLPISSELLSYAYKDPLIRVDDDLVKVYRNGVVMVQIRNDGYGPDEFFNATLYCNNGIFAARPVNATPPFIYNQSAMSVTIPPRSSGYIFLRFNGVCNGRAKLVLKFRYTTEEVIASVVAGDFDAGSIVRGE